MLTIYFKVLGGHVHCRVFSDGASCGELVFCRSEWPAAQMFFARNVIWHDMTVKGDKKECQSRLTKSAV